MYFRGIQELKKESRPLVSSYIVNKSTILKNFRFEKLRTKELYSNIKLPYLKGNIHINYKKNNVFMCLTTKMNKIITKASAGSISKKFIGKKRATFYAKESVAGYLAQKAFNLNYKILDLDFKHTFIPWANNYVVKGFKSKSIFLRLLKGNQKIPHGMIRLKKQRRL